MAIVALLRERSIDADALMAAVGLPAEAFGHPDNVIPFARLGELARLAADHTGLADIGLRACTRTGLEMFRHRRLPGWPTRNCRHGIAPPLQSYLHLHDEGAAPICNWKAARRARLRGAGT